MTEELLFTKYDSHSIQEAQRKAVQDEIAKMDDDRLLNTNPDDLVAYMVEKYCIEIPDIHEDRMTADQREAKREVSGDPFRMTYGRGAFTLPEQR